MSIADRFGKSAIIILGSLTLFFLSAPLLVIAFASLDPSNFFTFPPKEVSLHWYFALVADPVWRAALLLTLQVSVATGLLAGAIGTLAGIGVSRSPTTVRRFLWPIILSPLVIPAIVLAISFYTLMLQARLVGNVGTFVAVNALLTTPIVTLLVASAADGMDRRLEFASLACGAGPLRTFRRITLPFVAPTALGGMVIAGLLAIDEVVMSVFLVTPEHIPLAVKMFLQVRNGTGPIVTAAATLVIMIGLLLATVLTTFRVAIRRRQSGGPPAQDARMATPFDLNTL